MEKEVKIISAETLSLREYFSRTWKYRNLVYVLALREIKGTYAQTYFGWVWMVFKPLMVLSLFTLLFDQWLDLDTGSIQYPAFAFAGMSIWYFFSTIVHTTGSALLHSSDLIRKIYFPRLILLLAKSAVALIDLAINMIILMALLMIYNYTPSISWLAAIPIILLVYFTGLAIGIWISVLSIKRRDVQHLIPHLVNFAIWLTPVFYPVTIIPAEYRTYIYLLNPIATCIDYMRHSMFGIGNNSSWLVINILTVTILFGGGLYNFTRKEKSLVDDL